MSALDQQLAMADQQMATGGVIFLAAVSFVIANALFKQRRYPHLLVWLVFFGWTALVSSVPTLRAMDEEQVWFYCLRGLTLGPLIASMANFAQLTASRDAHAQAAAAAAE